MIGRLNATTSNGPQLSFCGCKMVTALKEEIDGRADVPTMGPQQDSCDDVALETGITKCPCDRQCLDLGEIDIVCSEMREYLQTHSWHMPTARSPIPTTSCLYYQWNRYLRRRSGAINAGRFDCEQQLSHCACVRITALEREISNRKAAETLGDSGVFCRGTAGSARLVAPETDVEQLVFYTLVRNEHINQSLPF